MFKAGHIPALIMVPHMLLYHGGLPTEKISAAAMPLTRDFRDTIRDRAQRDPKFRKELLREGLEAMLSGDITLAKTILRDYIDATVGFTGMAEATHIPPKRGALAIS
jgi:hypothetical protein